MARRRKVELFGIGAVLAALGMAATVALGSGWKRNGPDARSSTPPGPSAPWTSMAYEWRPVAIGGGGFTTRYVADRSGRTRVIRTDVYGAYLWNEDTDRWVQLVTASAMTSDEAVPMRLNEGVFEVAVGPNDPARIYLALDGGVFRSLDRGRSFVRTALPPVTFNPNSRFRHYGPFMSVSPNDSDVVLFGTPEAGLWRTADGGDSWAQVATVPRGGDMDAAPGLQSAGIIVWFAPTSGEVWAMSAGNGVFRSVDAGQTFQPLTTAGEAPSLLRQGQFAPDGSFYGVDNVGRAVWKFSDGRWANLTRSGALRSERWGSVAVNPRDGEVFVVNEAGHVFTSSNGGARWARRGRSVRVGHGEPPWLRVTDRSYFATGQVVFDPVLPDRLWGATGTGPYFADLRSGESVRWTSQVRGIEELVANDVAAPPGHSPLFGVWDFGVHVKPNLNAFSSTYGPKERMLIAVQQLAYNASDPSFVVTNASDTRTNCCSEDGDSVLAGFSTDGGVTWSKFRSIPTPPGTESNDAWRMSFGAIAVATGDSDNIVWAPTWNRSPFYTRDRGVTWRRVVLPGERLPNTGSHRDYFFHRRTLAADPVAVGVFYLVHSGDAQNEALTGLWITRDGGQTWARIFAGEIAPNSHSSAKLRPVPGREGHLFFTSDVFTPPDSALRRSLDGGRTWMTLETVTDVHDVAFGRSAPGGDYPAIYVAGRIAGAYGIWRSVDNAISWVRLAVFPLGLLDEVVTLGADQDVFGRLYIGFKGSGFVYGEPSTCEPAAYSFGDTAECQRVVAEQIH